MTMATPVFGLSMVSLWLSLQGVRVRDADHQVGMWLLRLSLVLSALALVLAVAGLVLELHQAQNG